MQYSFVRDCVNNVLLFNLSCKYWLLNVVKPEFQYSLGSFREKCRLSKSLMVAILGLDKKPDLFLVHKYINIWMSLINVIREK